MSDNAATAPAPTAAGITDPAGLAERYLAVWNEKDAGERARALGELFAEDCSYTDPLADVRGHAGLTAVIEGVRGQFPGFALRLAGSVDAHHNTARFTWELAPEGGGEAPVVGFDVVTTDEQGRIRAVYGFLDRVPAM